MMLMPLIKYLEVPLITISGDDKGPMPQNADVALTLGNIKEACPLGLAPTLSTTATLVLGDALAVALLDARGFTVDDFVNVTSCWCIRQTSVVTCKTFDAYRH